MYDVSNPHYMGDHTGTRKFRRVLLKLSGEALREPGSTDNISPPIVEDIAAQIKAAHQTGLEIAVVVGGGNFWRGVSASNKGMERATADYMGMLATVMNSLALQSMLEAMDVPTRVQSAIEMKNVAEPFIRRVATRHLELGRVVIFAAGTGNPFFSTDTTAALRASEVGADCVFKATKVDGIYCSDPNKNPDAVRFDTISFHDCLTKQLKVMDATAFSLCMENNMPIIVFSMNEPDNIRRALVGESMGTLVNASGKDA
ncbi:uridylate kinase [Prosthecobacter debontii]|uniref:Uridylate kinase n=1 Tax=Prosthecobacter debontii TaxID=48467 RepID=A0A1T4YN92_9BACT|nr:UMP kinase [Prosthecobacter debontii]SKB03153.1 uridylate kinase [Prosthecobacter debontii]